MTATTPNLDLPYPEPTDFVVDVDDAIQALAEALDTPPRVMVSGRYYRPPYPVTATSWAGLTVNTCSLVPMRFDTAGTIDRLGINVEVAGAAGAVARMGLYEETGLGRPGALLLDGGTIPVTSTGFKTMTISHAVDRGEVLWIACATQVAVATFRLANGVMSPDFPVGDPTGPNADYPGYSISASGALPNPSGIAAATAASIRAFIPYVRLA